MQTRFVLVTAILMVVTGSVLIGQNQGPTKKKAEITESESELLWKGRYAHCDYGFYVLLPQGYVAHSSLPPSPNHGFLVGLPDPATVHPVSVDDQRFIYVTAEYNSLEFQTLGAAAESRIDLTRGDKKGFEVIKRQRN